MKWLAAFVAALTLTACVVASDEKKKPPPTTSAPTTTTVATGDWQIAWDDSFTGTTLNLAKWNYDGLQFGSGNNVDNVNLASNVFIRNNMLVIRAQRQNYTVNGKTYSFTAGSVQTEAPYQFRKGQIFETKFRTNSMLSGVWPAVWSSSPSPGDDSEIDLVELFGNAKTAHVGIFWDYSPTQKDQREFPYNNTDWHYWKVEWFDTIRFYLDSQLVYEVPKVNADKMTTNPQLVRVTYQVGGTWGGPIDPALQTAEIETEYVRVWEKR